MNLEVGRLTLLQEHLLSLIVVTIAASKGQTLPISGEYICKLLFLIYLLMVKQLHFLFVNDRLLEVK